MRRHLWREAVRQLEESRAASLVAFLLLSLGGGWAFLVLDLLLAGQQGLGRAEDQAVVAAVLRDRDGGQLLEAALRYAFPSAQVRLLSAKDVAAEVGPWLGSGELTDLCPALVEVISAGASSGPIQRWLAARPEVVTVQASSELTATARRRFRQALRFLGAFSGVLVVGFVAIVILTVRLLVLSHADEIAIMRLIGAYDSDIRAPYVVAHTLLGLVGGLGALVVAKAGELMLARLLGLPPLSAYFLAIVVLACTATGTLGALLGVRSLPEEP